jgi:hypothetical protein
MLLQNNKKKLYILRIRLLHAGECLIALSVDRLVWISILFIWSYSAKISMKYIWNSWKFKIKHRIISQIIKKLLKKDCLWQYQYISHVAWWAIIALLLRIVIYVVSCILLLWSLAWIQYNYLFQWFSNYIDIPCSK